MAPQVPYEPFRPARAQSEEVGDILAEGLINLLEEDGPGMWTAAVSTSFWSTAVSERGDMLKHLIRRLTAGGEARAAQALRAALDVHPQVTPDEFVQYIRSWREDLESWRCHLQEMAAVPSADPLGSLQRLHRAVSWLHPAGPPRTPPRDGLLVRL